MFTKEMKDGKHFLDLQIALTSSRGAIQGAARIDSEVI